MRARPKNDTARGTRSVRCAGRTTSVVALLIAAPGIAASQTPAPTVTAFVDVSVIPMDRERVLPHQTVLVRGNRIVALGPHTKVKVPAKAVRLDGRGKYLIPGLADMHAHVNADQTQLWLYLANGVTTVRDMFGRPPTVAFRDQVARGELLGPRIYTASTLYDGYVKCREPGKAADDGMELDACLAAMKAAGMLMVKIHYEEPGFRSRFDSIVVIARKLHLAVGGHVSPYVGLGPSLQVPYASIEHLFGYFEALIGTPRTTLEWDLTFNSFGPAGDTARAIRDTASWRLLGWRPDPRKLQEVVAATRQAGTWNAPTLVVFEAQWNPCSRVPMTQVDTLVRVLTDVRYQLVKALQDGGAGLLLSTDMPEAAGFAVHRELELLVLAGLTPYQALVTGTSNVARYLGTEDSTGTVAVGKRADLVMLEGNPLQDIRNTSGPAGVMVGGRWLSRVELEAGLDSLVAKQMGGRDLLRLRQQPWLHQGIRLNDSTPLPAESNTIGDVCQRIRPIGH